MTSSDLSARDFVRVYLESISWTILALAGFLGNILVFAALARNPMLRRHTPIYVTALAISDILNFVTNGVFVGVTLASGHWQFGQVGCFVCGFSVLFLTHVTIGTMSFTAINRYVRVTKPELFKKLFTPRKSLTAMIVVWQCLSQGTSSPDAIRENQALKYEGTGMGFRLRFCQQYKWLRVNRLE